MYWGDQCAVVDCWYERGAGLEVTIGGDTSTRELRVLVQGGGVMHSLTITSVLRPAS